MPILNEKPFFQDHCWHNQRCFWKYPSGFRSSLKTDAIPENKSNVPKIQSLSHKKNLQYMSSTNLSPQSSRLPQCSSQVANLHALAQRHLHQGQRLSIRSWCT